MAIMNTAQEYLKTTKPYRKKLITRQPDMYGRESWVTRRLYLSNKIITSALDGRDQKGYFSTRYSCCLTLDIDAHSHFFKNWQDSIRLVSIYDKIRAKFPKPLAVYQTPRELRLYWLLDRAIGIKQLIRSVYHYLPIELHRVELGGGKSYANPNGDRSFVELSSRGFEMRVERLPNRKKENSFTIGKKNNYRRI